MQQTNIITIDLNGSWQLYQKEKSIHVEATVPGCAHTDLQKAGIINDPFFRDTEQSIQWISDYEWTYRRAFLVTKTALHFRSIRLICEGLDTLASIAINGKKLATTDNMFRRWIFDVREYLVPGGNVIEIQFQPVRPYLDHRQQVRRLPDWSQPFEPDGRGWIRKEPCNFGWDWGPVLVTCGIWRDIYLSACDTARIDDIQIKQNHSKDGHVTVHIDTTCEALSDLPFDITTILSFENTIVAKQTKRFQPECSFDLSVDNPQRWWPNGLGDQPLYTLSVELYDESGKVIDSVSKRMGLRTLRLEKKEDEWGESFQFVVNDVPFFAKGANWIPGDAFVTRLTDNEYRNLLENAAGSHMNMLRVWGGGIYEQDIFYNLCDELGICIWQDFIFSCSTYPSFNDGFVENVGKEAEDAIRRLRHHPCLTLWCGNNELEQGLVGNSWTSETMSWTDYDRLFGELLPGLVERLDPDRDYWPSSPHSPADRTDYNNPTNGDAHLWDVWHHRQPFEWYRTCWHRFISEFGFQSFPAPKTVDAFTNSEDRNVTSYVMELHQRSGKGNALILHYMLDWFRLPNRFDMTLWLSQILQGLAIKYAVEHWRRSMPQNMGALYWQLNDCWPVASWSSIDYFGRCKALHYMAGRFFAPVMISAVENEDSGTVDVFVTSDLLEKNTGDLAYVITDLEGTVLSAATRHVEIVEQTSSLVHTFEMKPYLEKPGARDLLVWITLKVKGDIVSENLVAFARPKHLDLKQPSLKVSLVARRGESFTVSISSEKPALWVWLDMKVHDAKYSDNYFHLRPGQQKIIHVSPTQSVETNEFFKDLCLYSLIDTYSM